MTSPYFVYLPESRTYLNLALVAAIEPNRRYSDERMAFVDILTVRFANGGRIAIDEGSPDADALRAALRGVCRNAREGEVQG